MCISLINILFSKYFLLYSLYIIHLYFSYKEITHNQKAIHEILKKKTKQKKIKSTKTKQNPTNHNLYTYNIYKS